MAYDNRECIPAIIGGTRVLLYSRIDQRHRRGRTWVVEPYGVVICEEKNGPGVRLFTCGDDWMPLQDSWHSSLEEALAAAEPVWIGIGATWETPP